MTNAHRKAVVVGLDGATWDVIAPLGMAGRLPHLWGLATAGTRGPLRSTIPPLTFPAFPSLLSGLNPGRHGILGPEAVDLGAYRDEGRRLTVSGARRDRSVQTAGQCHSLEITYSRFARSIELPVEVDAPRVSAECEDGMLMVRIQAGR